MTELFERVAGETVRRREMVVAEAQRRKDWSARLHTAAHQAAEGEKFTIDGDVFRRRITPGFRPGQQSPSELRVLPLALTSGQPLPRL